MFIDLSSRTLISLEFNNVVGIEGDKTYSDYQFDFIANLYKGLVVGPPGSDR